MIDLLAAIVAIIILVIVFIVCREIVCWYNKVNLRVELLEEQLDVLKDIRRFVEIGRK